MKNNKQKHVGEINYVKIENIDEFKNGIFFYF